MPDHNAVILGFGESGRAVLKFLLARGYYIYIYDDKLEDEAVLKKIELLIEGYLEHYNKNNSENINLAQRIINNINAPHKDIDWQKIDFVFSSPGIPSPLDYSPEDNNFVINQQNNYHKYHDILKLAIHNNIKILSDLDIFCNFADLKKNAKIIAITGTNGKTTTTALTGHIFSKGITDKKSAIGGNISPAICELDTEKDYYIFELSSYQLASSHAEFSRVDIAIILNITPDHLERHGNMNNYSKVKSKIFDLLDPENGIAIIIIGNSYCHDILRNLSDDESVTYQVIAIWHQEYFDSCRKSDPKNISKILQKENIENYYISCNGHLKYLNHDIEEDNKILSLNQFEENLPGRHNYENISASYFAAYLSGLKHIDIEKHIKSFHNLDHRMQKISEIEPVDDNDDGKISKCRISIINDSKATNFEAALQALNYYENIIWIAGGVVKSCCDWEGFAEPISKGNVKQIVVFGKDKDIFYNNLSKHHENRKLFSISKAQNLQSAVMRAFEVSKELRGAYKNVTILFSPAAASFDMWKNYEERGGDFCKIVADFIHDSKY